MRYEEYIAVLSVINKRLKAGTPGWRHISCKVGFQLKDAWWTAQSVHSPTEQVTSHLCSSISLYRRQHTFVATGYSHTKKRFISKTPECTKVSKLLCCSILLLLICQGKWSEFLYFQRGYTLALKCGICRRSLFLMRSIFGLTFSAV